MSIFGYESAYRVGNSGTTVVSGASSASTTLPNSLDGKRARVVRLQVTGNLYVKFTRGAGTATTNDMLLSPNFDVLVDCGQYDTISYIQETASAKLNVIPLET